MVLFWWRRHEFLSKSRNDKCFRDFSQTLRRMWRRTSIKRARKIKKEIRNEVNVINVERKMTFMHYTYSVWAASVVYRYRAGLWYPSSRVQTLPKSSAKKILSTPSFGGEVKPSVSYRTFTASKRFLNDTWKSGIFRQNSWAISSPSSSSFHY